MRDPKLAAVPVVIVSASGFSRESIRTQSDRRPMSKSRSNGPRNWVIRELMRSRP
jgi:hypothetical protein